MILIWFWYAKVMIFLWFWNLSVFLIWFWYDFLMVLESLRFFIWFWYDFLIVLESLRFLDMIFLWFRSASVFLIWFSYGFEVPPSFWYDFVVVFVRSHLPPPSFFPPVWPIRTRLGPYNCASNEKQKCTRTRVVQKIRQIITKNKENQNNTTTATKNDPQIPQPDLRFATSKTAKQQKTGQGRGTLWFRTLVSFWFF